MLEWRLNDGAPRLKIVFGQCLFVGELFGVSYIPPCIIAVAIARSIAAVLKK